MATHTFVDFEQPEAFELSRLTSIEHDLRSARNLCTYLENQIALAPDGWPPADITDAFSTAIVVRYSRAFVTGVRNGLGKRELTVLSQEQLDNHNRLRALRDKHIAHSVNAFENTRVQARYCLERVNDEGITSISAAHYRVFGLSQRDIENLKELCTCLLAHVDQLIDQEKKALLPVIRARPLEEVLTTKASPLMSPTTARVDKRRSRP
jgi:hypothetical protein